jgi:Cu/Ag efflux protein CusF
MPSPSLLRVWAVSMSPERHVCGGFCKRWSLLCHVSFVLSLLAFSGCAAYTPAALTTAYPAHPEAVATPEPPASTTLAYTPADIPSSRQAAAAARGRQGASPPEPKGGQTVVGEGKVIAVVPASSEIVLTHGAITGFMDAMTMGYPTQPPSLLQGVQAGDAVRFTIDTEQKAIVKLEKLPQ